MPNEIKKAEKIVETNPDSALHILQQIYPSQKLTDADRALYGIVLFKALSIKDLTLQPDSAISFSVNYYENTNDKQHLAQAYYYKARLLKNAQQYEKATEFYFSLLDIIQSKNNFGLIAKTYSDLGDICLMQADFKNGLAKYKISYDLYVKTADAINSKYKLLDIGKTYRLLKEYKLARNYYNKLLKINKDSLIQGLIYQEVGANFYNLKRFDSAQYFLCKSLKYPNKGASFAIRNYVLADLYFDLNQFDSSTIFALNSLKYPANFYTRKGCYRILVNSRYSLKDNSSIKYYISKYQDYNDSVRKLESQTKVSVLEDLHQKTGTTSKFKSYLVFIGSASVVLISIGLFLFFKLKQRNKTKEVELDKANEAITKNQTVLRQNLIRKIEEAKTEKTAILKKLSIPEKEKVLIEIYNQCLKLKYWNEFTALMNQTFNNLIVQLETHYPDINHKEITWICLFLLDVTLTDMALILESQPGSIYKLKQRVAQKMNVSSTKELESLLQNLSEKL
jgi:tetratricopeptide (TPR) repeat protein